MAVVPFELTAINLSTEDQNFNDLFSEVYPCFLAHRIMDPVIRCDRHGYCAQKQMKT
jgi:hypothetical protein